MPGGWLSRGTLVSGARAAAVIAIGMAVTMAVGTVLGTAAPAPASAAGTQIGGRPSLSAGAPVALPGCDGRWRPVVTGLDPSLHPAGVAAVDRSDVWVVGDVASGGSTTGVAEHWNGRRWTQTTFPALLSLQQVSASGPQDVWAAGIDPGYDTVIMRFDGTSWTRLAVQPPLTSRDGINALLARSDHDVWGFGVRLTAAGASPISVHWDGVTWRLVGSRLARSPWSVLLASAPGRDGDIWLAGVDVDVTTQTMRQYAGHVVGDRITRVSLPSVPDEDDTEPTAITVTRSGDVAVVGWTGSVALGVAYPYSAVRNGTTWRLAAGRSPSAPFGLFAAVAQVGDTVWAAGMAGVVGRGTAPFEHLAAGAWSPPQSLNAHVAERTVAMAGLPSGEGWALSLPDDPLPAEAGGRILHLCPGVDSTVRSTVGSAVRSAVRPVAPFRANHRAGQVTRSRPVPGSGLPARWRPGFVGDGLAAPALVRARRAAGADPRLVAAQAAAVRLNAGRPVARAGTLPLPATARPGPEAGIRRPGGPAAWGAIRPPARGGLVAAAVCPTTVSHRMTCRARVVSRAIGGRFRAVTADLPVGNGPQQFRSAYGLPGSGGHGRTVAIVDALGYPEAARDLAVYRAEAGLPACTVATRCLRIVDQRGGAHRPPADDDGWALEQALDLDVASAICPDCALLLVQADGPDDEDLAEAQQTAARLGAYVISDSFGRQETAGDPDAAAAFTPPGPLVVAATGDVGYGVSFPASIGTVLAVGGTTLLESPGSARGWSERAWRYGGSGCSAIQPRPAWQAGSGCPTRSTADVAADADPGSGAGVYSSRGLDGETGWFVVGGTSLATPLVAARAALLGRPDGPAAYWRHTARAADLVGGTNGFCAPARVCTALHGYDGPTGWGSPRL